MNRRGVIASLAAFFGFAPLAEFGDVDDADLDSLVGDKEKTADGSRVVSCQPGDEIEIVCGGMRCRAVVDHVSVARHMNPYGFFMKDECGDVSYSSINGVPSVTIDLTLRNCGEITQAY